MLLVENRTALAVKFSGGCCGSAPRLSHLYITEAAPVGPPPQKMNFLTPLVRFVVQLGYFGPFVMGIMDSSFLVLPFGNDLLVVGLVAAAAFARMRPAAEPR